MTSAFDPRIVTVTISGNIPLPAGSQGPTQQQNIIFTSTAANPGLDMRIRGKTFFGTTMGQAEIRIANISSAQRNSILTLATPIVPLKAKRNPVYVTVDIGRNSYGTFRLFEGTCWASGVTSAPDMILTLTSLTNNALQSTVDVNTEGLLTPISAIVGKICSLYQWTPQIVMKNPEKMIANFQYTGGSQNAIQKLIEIGNINVALDKNVLKVVDVGSYIGSPVDINLQNGMVGIPQANEWGVEVKTLVNPNLQIGGAINLTSITNPACNGTWIIYQIGYEVTNRDDPFWYDLSCKNIGANGGTG